MLSTTFVTYFATYFEGGIFAQEVTEALQLIKRFFGHLFDEGPARVEVFYGLVALFNIARQCMLTCLRGSAVKETECWGIPVDGELVLKVRVMELLFLIAEST